jgi:protein TonB
MLVWFKSLTLDKLIGTLLMLVLHALVLYSAMSYKLIPPPDETVTLMVNLINPPPLKKEEPPLPEPRRPPPKKVVLEKPKPVDPPKPVPMLVAEATVTNVSEYVAPPPPPEPIIETTPMPEAVVVAPPSPPANVTLTSELSLACPHRTPPDYPIASRRLAESGRVVLRVELDETGQITTVKIKESSGYKRLDEAGLAAVRMWRCNAAIRGGEAVRAVALQPFDFVLN